MFNLNLTEMRQRVAYMVRCRALGVAITVNLSSVAFTLRGAVPSVTVDLDAIVRIVAFTWGGCRWVRGVRVIFGLTNALVAA